MPLTPEQRLKLQSKVDELQAFDVASASDLPPEFDVSSARGLDPESEQFGFFGSVPESAFQRGERNVAGNLFERPGAAMRAGIQAMAPGGTTPQQAFRQASINPAGVPNFQDLALNAFHGNPMVQRASQTPGLGIPTQALGNVASAAGLAADVVTNPLEMAASLAPFTGPGRMIGQAISRSGLGQRASRPLSQFFQRRPLTVSEVMQTPTAKLPKLTQGERSEYFRIRSQTVKKQFATKQAALKQEQVAISQELGKSLTKRSLELRGKSPEFLGRQSAHFRELADAELAPLANEDVSMKSLAEFTKKRWGKDPEALAEVSSRLGLTNESIEITTLSPLLDDLGRPIQQVTPNTMKLGQLYTQAKELGESIPSSVRASLRTYNRSEHFIDNAIDTLIGFLKQNGVDLSEARTFWSSWARVRDQLVREVRPYNTAGTETGQMSKRLLKIMKGIDPDNAIYSKVVAEGMGLTDLPGPVKAIFAKLDTNQKGMVANLLAQKEAEGSLAALKFEISQSASLIEARRKAMSTVRRWLAAGAALAVGGNVVRGAFSEQQ